MTDRPLMPKNPWLEGALELRKLLEKEPESVQQAHHEMDTGWLRYPEYRKAKREREELEGCDDDE